jgi:predicted RNA binding protein YcfA (HicA-like mRNA interferase family)
VARLANISGKEAVRAFEKAGWKRVGQVGSHVVMSKPGLRVNLSIPQHRELSLGTLRALIRHAGMTVGLSRSALALTPHLPACPAIAVPALHFSLDIKN